MELFMAIISFSIDERQHLRLLRIANDKNLSVEELLRDITKAELDRATKKEQKK
jgi:hypothetical protein